MRLFAFALYAGEHLAFTRGISTDDEPDLWEKDLTGDILRWIEVGQPDETRIRKACNRAREVVVIAFSARSPEIWWEKIRSSLTRFDNLTVLRIPPEASATLAGLAARSMDWQVTIQDGVAFVSSPAGNVEIAPVAWRASAAT